MARSRLVALAAVLGVLLGAGGSFTVPAEAMLVTTHDSSDSTTAAHRGSPRNLLHGDSATFEHSTGGWSSSTATLRNNHTTAHHGHGSLAVHPRLTPKTAPVRVVSKAVPGRSGVYTASVWVRGPSAHSPVSAALVFLNAAHLAVAVVSGSSSSPTGNWAHVSSVTGFAPAGTRYVQAGLLLSHAQLTSTLYVDDARLTHVRLPHRSQLRRVSVHRNHIVDGHGHRVIFRGINRPGLETKSDWIMTSRDVDAMARWGVNLVRLPLSPNFWLRSGCAYDRHYRGRVDTIVQQLTRAHIVALLDLHTVTPCGATTTSYPMPNKSLAIPFWHQVARRYKHNPLVAFDLWNEPHNVGTPLWLHGGTVNWAGKYTAAGMQSMYRAVRSTGARNLVFVSGLYWAASPAHKTVRGHNIVYAEHAYTCPHDPPPNCSYTGVDPYDPSGYLARWDNLARRHPVVVTEFGWPNRSDPGRYIRNLIHGAQRRGRGWAVYGYNSTTNGKFDIVARRLKSAVYEPTPVGMPAVRALAAAR
jgi:hypothetical protein